MEKISQDNKPQEEKNKLSLVKIQKEEASKDGKKPSVKAENFRVEARAQIVELAAAPEKILKQVSLFEELKRKLLSEKDYQNIAGRRYIKKSGWRMFALAFNLSDQILKEERKQYKINNQDYFVWEVRVRVTAPNDRFAEATASCASNEKKFAHPEHDVRATAHTRAKNRAIADLIGGGEVSAEEMDGIAAAQGGEGREKEAVYTAPEEQMATHKQLAFIRRLSEEKSIDDISKATGVKIDDSGIITKHQASEVIEKLMAM